MRDDRVERKIELLAAIAAQRMEDVAGKALRVDAHDGWFGREIGMAAVLQDDGFFHQLALRAGHGAGRERALEAENAEVAAGGGQAGFGDFEDAAEHIYSV